MADLTDMTLENFKLWSSNALRIYESRWKNNINGNFDELLAISGHLVTLHFRNHQILVISQPCAYLGNVSNGSILHLVPGLNSDLYL